MDDYASLRAKTDEELEAEAKDIFRNARHWSRVCAVVGLITDRSVYRQRNLSSPRAYAEEVLGIPRSEFYTHLNLWRMMKRADQIELYEWAELSRAKASVLQKILALGGDQRIYFEQARSSDSTDSLRKSLVKMLGTEEWTLFRVRIPVDMVGLVDAAMERALRVVDPDNADPERLEDADVRFRCFEEITRAYLNAAPVPV